jgi:hypothetical protein
MFDNYTTLQFIFDNYIGSNPGNSNDPQVRILGTPPPDVLTPLLSSFLPYPTLKHRNIKGPGMTKC